ncbi:hypothetical protein [Nonomuraea sp. NPDC049695]|uniref:hypothetical protein n=1 Tax=Nonomuraea sp. NPDC049695 TaxID=3154734 RepID=UPI003446AA09
MLVRPLVTACVSVLLLSLAACGGGPEPQTAPSSPATPPPPASGTPVPDSEDAETKAPTPAPSRRPALARPGTVCGEIQPSSDGPIAAVAVAAGRVDCGTALRTFRTYYRRDTPKQGSAGVATVGGWRCASNSAAQANISGRLSTCQKAATKIVADVVP